MNINRKIFLEKELKRNVSLLKRSYNPDKVILFGSLSKGNVNEWSDIDLLIVKDTDKPFYDRIKEVFVLLEPKAGMDVLVYTPDEYKSMKKTLFFRKEILDKGSVLYEKN